MKFLLLLSLFINLSFASYNLSYKGINLGEVENFDSLEQNYLEAKVTNSIARFFLGKDYFVFYNDESKIKRDDENTKYKRDKYAIIYILKKALKNDVKEETIEVKKNKFIKVSYDGKFNFVYNSNGKIKSEGYLEMENSQIKKLVEKKNDIEISKKTD